ncbi:MAG: threonine-phosphate decarboxylase [Oscillospiraceae bacterium]
MEQKTKKDFGKHGGDIYSLSKNQGEIIDFSANISPLGLPSAVKQAIITAMSSFDKYPDTNCTKLCERLGEYYNLPNDYFYCGNGAGDIIFRFVKAAKPKNALILAPSFSEYSLACDIENVNIKNYCLSEENDFATQNDILDYIDEKIDVVFICNPNNPTGKITEKNLLVSILDKCRKVGAILFLDECFLDFTGEENLSCLNFVENNQNLVILKAFTKIYAMAGIRLGFAVTSNKDLIAKMKSCGQPWNVSTVAQVAGVSAIGQDEYKKQVIKIIKTENAFLKNGLESLGLKVFSSCANYMLLKNTINKIDLKAELIKQGILIRSCGNYIGLDERFYRIAVKNHKDNQKLLDSIEKVVNG